MKSIGRFTIVTSFLLALQSCQSAPETTTTLTGSDDFALTVEHEENVVQVVAETQSVSTPPDVAAAANDRNILTANEAPSLFFLRSRKATAAVEIGSSSWPFENDDENNPHALQSSAGDTCASQTDCISCTTHSSWCHWCEKQNECHSKGSFYGCFSGSQCSSPDDNGKNHTVDPDDKHGCASHQTCGECATASRFCHWCAHDQACHAIGSVYGCSYGVDCFSNDRCKRKEPERIHEVFTFQEMKALPIAIITGLAALICCCATVCFCVASGVKGAYDELADLATATNPTDSSQPLLDNDEHDEEPITRLVVEEDEQEEVNTTETAETFVTAVETGEAVNTDETKGDHNNGNESVANEEVDPLLAAEVSTHSVSNVRRSIRPRRPRQMQRLYSACTACYLVTLALVGTMVFCSIHYYPKVPVYNICNDDVAWKSIIDGMEKMKTEADFELLASISNPNHISVALDRGTGNFYHNGKFAGNFTIPPFTAQAMTITDVLIIAHLSPETWDAVAIAKEYYNKKLVLHVNTDVLVRVPALADFTSEGKMEDLVVHVNEINDRHLCACPSWDEAKNHSIWDKKLEVPWIFDL